jgi:hypothetical protein
VVQQTVFQLSRPHSVGTRSIVYTTRDSLQTPRQLDPTRDTCRHIRPVGSNFRRQSETRRLVVSYYMYERMSGMRLVICRPYKNPRNPLHAHLSARHRGVPPYLHWNQHSSQTLQECPFYRSKNVPSTGHTYSLPSCPVMRSHHTHTQQVGHSKHSMLRQVLRCGVLLL